MEKKFDDLFQSPNEERGCNDSLTGREESMEVLDLGRLEMIKFTHAVLKRITLGRDVRLSYELNEPFIFMGSVTLEGELLEFYSPEWFARAAEFASNLEIYPLTENKVRMTFTFHNLTTKI